MIFIWPAFSLKPEVFPFSGYDHPGIVIPNHLGGAFDDSWLGETAGWNPPSLMIKVPGMSGFDSDKTIIVRDFPLHLLTRVQEVRKFGHGVPAKSAIGFQATRLLQPVIHKIVVLQNSGRMEIHQPDRVVVGREVGHGCKPVLDLGPGISFCTHFLEASSSI